jgi:hypothetical protein
LGRTASHNSQLQQDAVVSSQALSGGMQVGRFAIAMMALTEGNASFRFAIFGILFMHFS